jgi:peptidoglycan hydrolase CwlO-like protein
MRLAAAAGAIAILVAGSPLSQVRVEADRFTQQIRSLSAQANALAGEIASLSHASSAALGSALATAQSISKTQSELAQAQTQLDRANQNLADTIKQVQAVHAEFAKDQTDLGQLLVHVYELSTDGSITRILVDSKSLQDAMDTLTSVDQVSSRVQTLVTQIRAKRDQLDSLDASVATAAESLRLTKLRYSEGESTVLEVVDAQSAFVMAENAREEGRVRFQAALADLETLTGTM